MQLAAMKVGTLSELSGITVRTLHYYDEIGLLKPSRRTQSGHRIYTDTDIARLQQIKSLQGLGFSLDEIQKMLTQHNRTPVRILERHISLLNDQIDLKIRLRHRLESLAGRYRSKQRIPVKELLQTIKEIARMDKYYTPEQLEKLRERGKMLGEDAIREVEQEWLTVFKEFKRAMDEGEEAESDRVQPIAERAHNLIQAFTGGDPGITKSLSNMYQKEGGANIMAQHGMRINPKVWEFMQKALMALKKHA